MYDRQDYPDVLFHRERLVTTRKPHTCLTCHGLIPTGTKASYIVLMTSDDDKPYHGWRHYSPHCVD